MRRCFFAFFCVSTSLLGSVIAITSPQSIPTNDVVYWSQFGPDQTSLGSMFNAGSTYNDSVNASLANSAGSATILVAGTDWTPKGGIVANDSLVSTENGTTAGGPLTLSFTSISEAGAFIQAAGGGAFTARIQAFAGFSSVLDTTASSDAAGDPVFLGVADPNNEITKIIYSLTAVTANHSLGNFVLDNLYLSDYYLAPLAPPLSPPQSPPPSGPTVPEPRFTVLLGFILLLFGWKAAKLSTCF
jgi:hypothetical protein